MKTKLIFAAIAAVLALSSLACYAGNVQYQVGKAYLTTQAGGAVVTEGATYLCIPVLAKNLSAKEVSLGGPFGSNFRLTQGQYSYDVDGGVGWTVGNTDFYDGLKIMLKCLGIW